MNITGNWTKTPNIILDAMGEMSYAELACTLLLVRETFGWHQDWARIPSAEFLRRTPIKSRSTLIAALKEVEARGFFQRTNRRSIWQLGPAVNGESRAAGGELESRDASFPEAVTSTTELGDSTADLSGSPTEPQGSQSEPQGSQSEPHGSQSEPHGSLSEPSAMQKRSPADHISAAKGSAPDPKIDAKRSPDDPFHYIKKPPKGEEKRGSERKAHTPNSAQQRELLDHPAAQAWLEVGLAFPGWVHLESIIQILGPSPNADALATAAAKWLLDGYSENNFAGILACYQEIRTLIPDPPPGSSETP